MSFRSLRFVAVLSVLASPVLAASPADRVGAGDPEKGLARLQAETCRECHGEDGNSTSPSYPKLAGQYAGYLIKQLRDYKSGARENPVMTVMARNLPDESVADVAAFFARLERSKGEGGANERGRELFATGDADRGITACASCHNPDAKGTAISTVVYPSLAGQPANYIREQLRNWRSGDRRNSPAGAMNKVAAKLTDADIAAVAEYLSGL